MGQKVNPHGIRLGIVKTWDAKWYADKDFADNLHEDIKIRDYLKNSLQAAGVSRIETERSKNRLKLTIHTAKPGMVIGRGGSGIEQIKEGLKNYTTKRVDINIAEIKQPDMDATLVAENIAQQLERRIAFRRAMKQAVGRTMRLGAKGIKVRQKLIRLMAASASRSGSSRAKFFRKESRQRLQLKGAKLNVITKESQIPQTVPWPHEGQGSSRQYAEPWPVRSRRT